LSKVERFEDIIAWQKARNLTKAIYTATSTGSLAQDFGLKDQLRRASVSVMSNIAEGFDRGGRSEFHQFLVIAKASCAEVRSQLYVALDAGYLEKDVHQKLSESAMEVSKIIGGLRKAVQNQRDIQR